MNDESVERVCQIAEEQRVRLEESTRRELAARAWRLRDRLRRMAEYLAENKLIWPVSGVMRGAIAGAVARAMAPPDGGVIGDERRRRLAKEVFGAEHWADLSDAEVIAFSAWAQERDDKGGYVVRQGALSEAEVFVRAWEGEEKEKV